MAATVHDMSMMPLPAVVVPLQEQQQVPATPTPHDDYPLLHHTDVLLGVILPHLDATRDPADQAHRQREFIAAEAARLNLRGLPVVMNHIEDPITRRQDRYIIGRVLGQAMPVDDSSHLRCLVAIDSRRPEPDAGDVKHAARLTTFFASTALADGHYAGLSLAHQHDTPICVTASATAPAAPAFVVDAGVAHDAGNNSIFKTPYEVSVCERGLRPDSDVLGVYYSRSTLDRASDQHLLALAKTHGYAQEAAKTVLRDLPMPMLSGSGGTVKASATAGSDVVVPDASAAPGDLAASACYLADAFARSAAPLGSTFPGGMPARERFIDAVWHASARELHTMLKQHGFEMTVADIERDVQRPYLDTRPAGMYSSRVVRASSSTSSDAVMSDAVAAPTPVTAVDTLAFDTTMPLKGLAVHTQTSIIDPPPVAAPVPIPPVTVTVNMATLVAAPVPPPPMSQPQQAPIAVPAPPVLQLDAPLTTAAAPIAAVVNDAVAAPPPPSGVVPMQTDDASAVRNEADLQDPTKLLSDLMTSEQERVNLKAELSRTQAELQSRQKAEQDMAAAQLATAMGHAKQLVEAWAQQVREGVDPHDQAAQADIASKAAAYQEIARKDPGSLINMMQPLLELSVRASQRTAVQQVPPAPAAAAFSSVAPPTFAQKLQQLRVIRSQLGVHAASASSAASGKSMFAAAPQATPAISAGEFANTQAPPQPPAMQFTGAHYAPQQQQQQPPLHQQQAFQSTPAPTAMQQLAISNPAALYAQQQQQRMLQMQQQQHQRIDGNWLTSHGPPPPRMQTGVVQASQQFRPTALSSASSSSSAPSSDWTSTGYAPSAMTPAPPPAATPVDTVERGRLCRAWKASLSNPAGIILSTADLERGDQIVARATGQVQASANGGEPEPVIGLMLEGRGGKVDASSWANEFTDMIAKQDPHRNGGFSQAAHNTVVARSNERAAQVAMERYAANGRKLGTSNPDEVLKIAARDFDFGLGPGVLPDRQPRPAPL